MLQFPTNVYPQNVAFDPTVADSNNRLSFTFNGDILTTANFKIYDYLSGELVSESHYATSDGQPWHYNDEEVAFANGTLGSQLTAGNDYVIQMMLTQCDANGAILCDMPVVRGKVQAVASADSITIEDKINNIYEWETSGGLNVPTWRNNYIAAGMVMQIGSESKLIESYNRATGALELTSPFTTTPQADDDYVIYSNYLITPQYYFMCRKTPTLAISTSIAHSISGGIDADISSTGTFSQIVANRHRVSMIKNYDFKLSWYDDDIAVDSSNWIPLKTSPKVYSQNIRWHFLGSLIGVNNASGTIGNLADTYYKVECAVTTQEGMTISDTDIIHIAANTSEDFVSPTLTAEEVNEEMPDYIKGVTRKKHQAIALSYTASDMPAYSTFEGWVYRRDLETDEVVFLGIAKESGLNHLGFYDYLVPNKGSFEYVVVPRVSSSGSPYVKAIKKVTVNTDMVGYTVTSLIPVADAVAEAEAEYGRYRYQIGDCWKFVGEIQDTSVTQNTNRALHVGAGRYTSLSMTDNNYSSGSLSAMIGAVDCADKKYKDTVDMVKAWREFITKNSVFLLKSQKGDVWVVNINDTPSTSYSEMEKSIPTTFNFDWAECMSANDIIINQD